MIDRIVTLLHRLVAFIAPTLAVLAPKAMAPLFLVSAVAALVLVRRDWRGAVSRYRPQMLWLAGIVLWGGGLSWLATDPGEALRLAGTLAGMFAGGLMLAFCACRPGGSDPALRGWLAAGLLICLALLIFETASGYATTRMVRGLGWEDIVAFSFGGVNVAAYAKNGVVAAILVFFPAAGWMWSNGRRLTAMLFAIPLVAVAIWTGSHTAMAALVIGLCAAIAGAMLPRLFRWAAGLTVLFVVTAPLIFSALLGALPLAPDAGWSARLPASFVGRLVIWEFAVEKIAERPLIGYGLDASRNLPGGNVKVDVTYTDSDGYERLRFRDFRMPLHPHNQVLQIWIELGAVGALLLAGFLAALLAAICRLAPADRAVAAGSFYAAFTFACSSFGAWQNWWLGLVMLVLFWAMPATGGQKNRPPR
jgi:O-antigen ligase